MRPVPTSQAISLRFWSKVTKTDTCWLWSKGKFPTGYGAFWVTREGNYSGQMEYAHRFAWEDLVGPITKGLTIDHLCRVRHCVRPEHLEPVSAAVNTLRGESPNSKNKRKTHCQHGHEFTEANTRISAEGWRSCKACAAAYQQEYQKTYRSRKNGPT